MTPLAASRRSPSRAASCRTTRACAINTRPMSVGTTGERLRSNRVSPSAASSFRSCIESVGWLTLHARAARAKWRCVSTDTAYASWVSVTWESESDAM